jgi:archaellum biogenesis ATPase FlaH
MMQVKKMCDNVTGYLEELKINCEVLYVDNLAGYTNNDIEEHCDIADIIIGNTNENIELIINEIISSFKNIISQSKQNKIISFGELKELESEDCSYDFLLSPLLPGKGLASIVGQPDSGKSQFCLQLCLSIALGLETFCDFILKCSNHKALYITTEDSLIKVRGSLFKKIEYYKAGGKDISLLDTNLSLLSYSNADTGLFVNFLKENIRKAKYDLILIDSFGDIFSGGDISNNTEMRTQLKYFNEIAVRNNLLILFIHHITKKDYTKKPTQQAAMGAGSYGQKIRVMLDIRNHYESPNVKYLSITKGNYISGNDKNFAYILNFDEDQLIFTNTGEKTEKHKIENTRPKADSISYIDYSWDEYFEGVNRLKPGDLYKKIYDEHGLKKRAAQDKVNEAVAAKILKRSGNWIALYSKEKEENTNQNSLGF